MFKQSYYNEVQIFTIGLNCRLFKTPWTLKIIY